MNTFTHFSLHPELVKSLLASGYTTPTEIQAKTIPLLLQTKRDLHAQAQTGSGKTLAFGIPLLQAIDPKNHATQGLIITPTRELTVQIYNTLLPLAKTLGISIVPVYGGVSMEKQLASLRHGAHVVVGTPGRLIDHTKRKSLRLQDLSVVVLDEADILLEMGFKEEIDTLLETSSPKKNIWLFSATVKPGILNLLKHLQDPISLRIHQGTPSPTSTQQFFCAVPHHQRLSALCHFLSANSFYGFIFCQTKKEAGELAEKLSANGFLAQALHGDMNQHDRNRTLQAFREKKFTILVATDVAARGIDILDATHVVNYRLPEDQESYIHRIGRTGRAGKTGTAITFILERDLRKIKMLERRFQSTIKPIPVPSAETIKNEQLKRAKSYLETLAKQQEKQSINHDLAQVIQTYSPAQQATLLTTLIQEKFMAPLKPLHLEAAPRQPQQRQYHQRSNGRKQQRPFFRKKFN